jgi:hypothetical protein
MITMSNVAVIEKIQLSIIAMLKDVKMQVKSFTAWNALLKTTNIFLTNQLKFKLSCKKESQSGKLWLKRANW